MITDMQDLFTSGLLGCGFSIKRSLSWSIGKFSLFVSRMIIIIYYRVMLISGLLVSWILVSSKKIPMWWSGMLVSFCLSSPLESDSTFFKEKIKRSGSFEHLSSCHVLYLGGIFLNLEYKIAYFLGSCTHLCFRFLIVTEFVT